MRYETFDHPILIPYWEMPEPTKYNTLAEVARDAEVHDIFDSALGGSIVKIDNVWYTTVEAAEKKGHRVLDSYRRSYEHLDRDLLERFKKELNYVKRQRTSGDIENRQQTD